MAVYRVRGPDGEVHRFEGPDDATPDQVEAAAAKQFAAPKPAEKAPDPTEGMSTTEKFLAGAGKAVSDTGKGLKQLWDIPANALENAVEGRNTEELISGVHKPTSLVGKLGNALGMPTAQASQQQTQASIDQSKQLDAPLMNTGAGVAGNIGGNVAMMAVPGMAAARVPMRAKAATTLNAVKGGSYVLPAAAGAVQGAIQPVASDESRMTNVLAGTAGGVGGNLLAKGVGAAAKGAAPKISKAVRDLANKAAEHGIDLRADQVANSKPVNLLSSSLDYLPFSGMTAAKTTQQKQFNSAISRTIGQDTDNVIQAVKSAEVDLGAKFDEVLKNHSVKADDDFVNGLAKVQEEAGRELKRDQVEVINKQIDHILSKVKDGDVIDADAAYNIKKGLDRIANNKTDTSLAHYAQDMRLELMNALNRSLPDDIAKGFAETRQQYKNMIDLRKLVPAGAEGDISAARLANAKNTSGGLKELSDIAGQFLKTRENPHGAAQRAGVAGSLLGAGYMGLPLPAIASGLTAGKVATKALNSDMARNYLVNGRSGIKSLQGVVPIANRLSPAVGAAASLEMDK